MAITINRILTTRRNCLKFDSWFYLGGRLIINRNEYEWETLNTPKIKTIFYSYEDRKNDFGTKIRFKCHTPIQRKAETLEGDLCTNWELIDNFGVRLDFDNSIHHTDGYKDFYDDPRDWFLYSFQQSGKGL